MQFCNLVLLLPVLMGCLSWIFLDEITDSCLGINLGGWSAFRSSWNESEISFFRDEPKCFSAHSPNDSSIGVCFSCFCTILYEINAFEMNSDSDAMSWYFVNVWMLSGPNLVRLYIHCDRLGQQKLYLFPKGITETCSHHWWQEVVHISWAGPAPYGFYQECGVG